MKLITATAAALVLGACSAEPSATTNRAMAAAQRISRLVDPQGHVRDDLA